MCSLYSTSSAACSSPKNAILPLSLCRLPTRILINVDLPEPFFPINPTVSLVEIVKDASWN